jgi:hypothetical protein
MARITPNECLSEALRWLLFRLLDLEQRGGRGVKCSCSRFGAVLDDEQKVAEAYLSYSRGRCRYVSLDGKGGCWSPGSSPGMIAREH